MKNDPTLHTMLAANRRRECATERVLLVLGIVGMLVVSLSAGVFWGQAHPHIPCVERTAR